MLREEALHRRGDAVAQADIVVDDPRRFDISGLEKQLGEFLSKLN